MTFKTHRSRFFNLVTSATALILILFLSVSAHAASQQELKGVSGEIQRQKQSLSQQQKELDKLQQELKKQELDIASQKSKSMRQNCNKRKQTKT